MIANAYIFFNWHNNQFICNSYLHFSSEVCNAMLEKKKNGEKKEEPQQNNNKTQIVENINLAGVIQINIVKSNGNKTANINCGL